MALVFLGILWLAPVSVVALWLGSIAWTAMDARRRCDARGRRLATAAAILFPFGGFALYALLRPCDDRFDVSERRVWREFLETQLLDEGERCLDCLTPLRPEFRCCPGCGGSIRQECGGCGRALRVGWAMCPWCLEPVTGRVASAA